MKTKLLNEENLEISKDDIKNFQIYLFKNNIKR